MIPHEIAARIEECRPEQLERWALRVLIIPIPADQLRQLNPYAVAFRYESSEQEWLSETEAAHMIEALHR